MSRLLNTILPLLALAGIVGCSDPSKGVVSGTVRVNGVPAANGAVSFIPLDGRTTTSGGVIKNGQYTVHAQPAKVRVEIRVPKVVGETKLYDTPDSPIQQVMAESLPPRYNDESELTLEIVAGQMMKDFDLEVADR